MISRSPSYDDAGQHQEAPANGGFSALVQADGHQVLVDTGASPDTVLKNAKALGVDLSGVRDVILTHNHDDHTSGLLTLRRELSKRNPEAMSRVYVGPGIFWSRPTKSGEDNAMIAVRPAYEATGGKFVEVPGWQELFPGAWFTGPITRKYPEKNWDEVDKVMTPAGLVEDTIPEDLSLVLNTTRGLVVITVCGHEYRPFRLSECSMSESACTRQLKPPADRFRAGPQ